MYQSQAAFYEDFRIIFEFFRKCEDLWNDMNSKTAVFPGFEDNVGSNAFSRIQAGTLPAQIEQGLPLWIARSDRFTL